MKKAKKFISEINVVGDSIIISYNDNSEVLKPYSYEEYLKAIEERHTSLNKFNIDEIKNEIFEGKIRRLLISILIISCCLLMNFNLPCLIVLVMIFASNEFCLLLSKNDKKKFDKAILLDNYEMILNKQLNENENIKNFVLNKCTKKNKSTFNELGLRDLKQIKRKLIEENIIEPQKNKVMKKIKK